jgi:hypothetical protein
MDSVIPSRPLIVQGEIGSVDPIDHLDERPAHNDDVHASSRHQFHSQRDQLMVLNDI